MAISVTIVLFVTLVVIGEFNTGSDLSNDIELQQQPNNVNVNKTYDQDEYDNRNDLYYVVNFINDFDVDSRNNKSVIENDEDEPFETDNFDQEEDEGEEEEEEEEEDVLKDFDENDFDDDDDFDDNVVEDYDDFEDDDDDIYGGSRHDKDEDDDEDEEEDEDDEDDEDDDEKDDEDDDEDDDEEEGDDDEEEGDDDEEEGDDDKVDEEEEDDDDDEEDPIDTEISEDEDSTNDSPKRSGSGSGLDRMARLRKYVEILNSRKSTWKAGINNLLKKPWKIRKRIMASAVVDGTKDGDNRSLPTVRHRITKKTRIPKSFDPRKKWRYCTKVINNIRNQKSCGSCWAESVAGAMSDRVCIRSRGKYKLWLSTVDFSCCKFCGARKGICWGGNGRLAWKYVQRVGLVTGGDRSNVGCKPFTMKAARSKCVPRCTNRHYKRSYKKDRFRTSRTYHISKNVKQIQLELMRNGPMETAISVQPEFAAYHRGVYKPKRNGKFIGWHSVRLVGWGSQKGEPYWLLANSWGTKWGEHGFFKISRKNNPAKVITMVTTGKPKVRA